MKFSIIGTGNTAWFLAKRLTNTGHTCVGIYGRNQQAVQTLADTISCPAYSPVAGIKDDADCCIIAITDHAIMEVANQLSFTNTVLVHTAGSVGINVLSPAAQHYGVLWPVYSITKTALPVHRNIPAVCEASDPKAEAIIATLAGSFSDKLFLLDTEQRSWLHLSAVLSNNFTNHLFAICEKIAAEKHIPFSLLLPIINQTVERLNTGAAYEMQTGPAKRGDNTILNKHEDMLQNHPDWQDLYKAISLSIEKMYRP